MLGRPTVLLLALDIAQFFLGRPFQFLSDFPSEVNHPRAFLGDDYYC